MYRVVFSVKRVDENDYGLLVDKVKKFKSMQAALRFSKTINTQINDSEILVGKPVIEDVA